MFIGRKKELDLVEKMYASDTFECLVLYGRRRVGKTALINEFVKNKRVIYFTGTDTTAQENLENLSQSIYQCGNLSGEGPVYKSYEQALDAIGNKCLQQKTVVVFDEYPYLAKSEPSISSILQKKIDLIYQKHGNMFLILCGSSMSFMEHQVLVQRFLNFCAMTCLLSRIAQGKNTRRYPHRLRFLSYTLEKAFCVLAQRFKKRCTRVSESLIWQKDIPVKASAVFLF